MKYVWLFSVMSALGGVFISFMPVNQSTPHTSYLPASSLCADDTSISIIDISNSLENEHMALLSDYAENLYYIQPEKKDGISLSDDLEIKLSDRFMGILDNVNRTVYLFTNKGRFIAAIGKNGTGPGEYIYPVDLEIADKDSCIYVLDSGLKKILVYGFTGAFLKDIPVNNQFQHMYKLGDSLHFLFIPKSGDAVNKLEDWEIIDLNGNVKWSVTRPEFYDIRSFAISGSYMYKDSVTIWQNVDDTIFRISRDSRVTPKYILRSKKMVPMKDYKDLNEFRKFSQYVICLGFWESSRCLFVEYVYQLHRHVCVYNKRDHSNFNLVYDYAFFDHGFDSNIDNSLPFDISKQASEKIFYNVITVASAKSTYSKMKAGKKKTSPQFDKLIDALSVDDNPLIQFAEFRE